MPCCPAWPSHCARPRSVGSSQLERPWRRAASGWPLGGRTRGAFQSDTGDIGCGNRSGRAQWAGYRRNATRASTKTAQPAWVRAEAIFPGACPLVSKDPTANGGSVSTQSPHRRQRSSLHSPTTHRSVRRRGCPRLLMQPLFRCTRRPLFARASCCRPARIRIAAAARFSCRNRDAGRYCSSADFRRANRAARPWPRRSENERD